MIAPMCICLPHTEGLITAQVASDLVTIGEQPDRRCEFHRKLDAADAHDAFVGYDAKATDAREKWEFMGVLTAKAGNICGICARTPDAKYPRRFFHFDHHTCKWYDKKMPRVMRKLFSIAQTFIDFIDDDDDDQVPWMPSYLLDRGNPKATTPRKRRHRMVKLVPVEEQSSAERCEDGSILLRDEVMLSDRLHARCPGLAKALWISFELSLVLFNLVGLAFPAAAPFATLAFTNASTILFAGGGGGGPNNNTKSNNSLNSSSTSPPDGTSTERPWPLAWEDASLVLVGLWLGINLYMTAYQLLFQSSPTMLRRLVSIHWPTLLVTVSLAWAYLAVAVIIQPHPVHVLWLTLVKGWFPLFLFFVDAVAVGYNMRYHTRFFAKIIGGNKGDGKKRNSTLMTVLFSTLFLFVALDICRHYLVINFGQQIELIRIANPFSADGKSLTWGTAELASGLYWGSTLVLISSFCTQVQKKLFRETTVNMTYYEIEPATSQARQQRVETPMRQASL